MCKKLRKNDVGKQDSNSVTDYEPHSLLKGPNLNEYLYLRTLHSWKFSDTSVSWTSISLGVGAAVGVPAALPHDGELIVAPGEEVVNPSNTFRNFFIFFVLLYALFLGLGGRGEQDSPALFVSEYPLRYKIPTRLCS